MPSARAGMQSMAPAMDDVIIDDDDEGRGCRPTRRASSAFVVVGGAPACSPSAILSCLCPCVQFGFNQRMAFRRLHQVDALLALPASAALHRRDRAPRRRRRRHRRARAAEHRRRPRRAAAAAAALACRTCCRHDGPHRPRRLHAAQTAATKVRIAGRCARAAAARARAAAATRPLTRPAARARGPSPTPATPSAPAARSRAGTRDQSQTLADVPGGADAEMEVVGGRA